MQLSSSELGSSHTHLQTRMQDEEQRQGARRVSRIGLYEVVKQIVRISDGGAVDAMAEVEVCFCSMRNRHVSYRLLVLLS